MTDEEIAEVARRIRWRSINESIAMAYRQKAGLRTCEGKTMSYRWYHIPGRAVLLGWALAKSVLGDWFPPHTCRNCEWSRDKGFTTLDCTFGCGEGYGRPVWPHDVCGQWQKKRSTR